MRFFAWTRGESSQKDFYAEIEVVVTLEVQNMS